MRIKPGIKLLSVLVAFSMILALLPAIPARAAGNVVWSSNTTLTRFINQYDNVLIKAGVTVTMKKFTPDPQGLEIYGSLIVEPGGGITGPGELIFNKTSTFSGIDLYYLVAGVEKKIPEGNFRKLSEGTPADFHPTFAFAASGHYVMKMNFNVDPYFDPNASENVIYSVTTALTSAAPARWGACTVKSGVVVSLTNVGRAIGVVNSLVVEPGGNLFGGQLRIYTTALPVSGIQLYYRYNGQIKPIAGNNLTSFWNGNTDPNNHAPFTYDIGLGAYVLDGEFTGGDPFNLTGDQNTQTVTGNGGTPITGDVVPVYRVFRPTTGEHLYTISTSERDSFVTAGWNDEGVAWYAPAKSDIPVYRVYHQAADYHHYTTSTEERDTLVAQGWQDQGIGWYSGGTTPLYRLYDPTAAPAGSHHYTQSAEERSQLLATGWNDEGTGWYGK